MDTVHRRDDIQQSEGRGNGLQVEPIALVQGLSNVQVGTGDVNVVARDFVQIHHHHHYNPAENKVEIPSLLQRVPNFRDIQMATLGKATAGTGDWIYIWKEFCVWLASDGYIRILWGSGMPGAGKTILASLAINAVEAHAQTSETPVSVGFLYIRYSDHTKVTVRDLLEVLVKQTIERHPTSLPLCNAVYARHIQEKTEPSTMELLGLLKRFSSELKLTTFYFLDALDEAPADVQLELLESLISLNVKLFITSRPMKLLEARFPEAHHFPIVAQDSDLDVHIGKEMSRSMELQAILTSASPGLQGRITLAIKRKCSGMFLHASLQMQALRECTNRHELETTLKDFPRRIKDVYIQTWTRIVNQPSAKVSLALNVLVWVLYATRSLTVSELRHAVVSSPDTHKLDLRRLAPAETLVSVCCGLLVHEQGTDIIRLVHYTAKPILRDLLLQSIPEPHTLLAAICMVRLSDCGFQRSALASEGDLDGALKAQPLLEYSYHAWSDHARESLPYDAAKQRLMEFVQGCHAFPVLSHTYGTFGVIGPLHLTAAFDLPPSLAGSSQLRRPNLAATPDGLTPLHLACIRNAQRSVKELLCLPRVLINASSKAGSTALIYASEHGHEGVVDLLLSHPQIKVNEATPGGLTALYRAISMCRPGTVKLLLAHPKIKVNQQSRDGGTPLIIACLRPKNMEILNALLAHPRIDVNLADKEGKTPLMYATTLVRRDGVEVVKALLEHPQIDVNRKDKQGWPALQWARRHGTVEVKEMLLAHPNIVDPSAPKPAPSGDAATGQSGVSRLIDDFSRISLPVGKK
ncbi:hypothetical protein BKA70DRAFT_1560343 [Coprinopsis sp. MPI-PUGE-AT-0042]|nr:hypothetical protein BKA70DRAFT_1560343 [Coprinopsis sp. MPI-PUGE-AT-0042]